MGTVVGSHGDEAMPWIVSAVRYCIPRLVPLGSNVEKLSQSKLAAPCDEGRKSSIDEVINPSCFVGLTLYSFSARY